MESQSIEYKKTWRDEYLKWICAFANTEGGKLYIGLDDAALDVSNETLIQNLHLTEGNYLTRACMLAFYPDPEKWVTGAYIKVAYFENDADILYQDEIHGPLILQVEKTMDLIYSKYMKALISYDDIYRKETFFFPRAAFRELLLNAVIHKDYLSTTPIQIRIYKDKIRLWNDGALPKEVPVENLYKEHVSKPCNPNLANVFFKCGMIESWARGFSKITRYCEEENAKLPEIDLSLGGVTARCFASDKYLALMNEHQETENVPLNVPLTERQKSIFEMIAKDKTLTAAIIADKLGKNEKTIKRDIDELKKQNLLKHSDSRNNGYWIILSGIEK